MFSPKNLDAKLNSPLYHLLLPIVFGIIIYLASKIGLLLVSDIESIKVSLIWPTSGIALALTLLFGVRALIGTFLGFAFFYYFYELPNNLDLSNAIFATLLAATGVVLQALVGAAIIRNYASRDCFKTVNDIFIFLVPTGILSCLISSSCFIFIQYTQSIISENLIPKAWLMYFLADAFSIYIFTPLIIVWTTHEFVPDTKASFGEGIAMFLSFLALTFAMTDLNWAVGQFYIPISIWITYRYRMHGATLINFFLTITGLVPTIYGFGAWTVWISDNQVPIVLVYIAAIVSTCLILAAVLNERGTAWAVLREYNVNLEEEVHQQRNTLEQLSSSMMQRNKMACIGMVILATTRKMMIPLKNLFAQISVSDRIVNELYLLSEKDPEKINNQIKTKIKEMLNSISEISKLKGHADKIIGLVEKQSAQTFKLLNQVTSINLHTLLNQTLESLIYSTEFPSVKVNKEYSRNLAMVAALPEDLTFAFEQIVKQFRSSIEKKYEQNKTYQPTMFISSKVNHDTIEVVIRDNGYGLNEEQLLQFNNSYIKMAVNPAVSMDDLALAIDIIQFIHRGEIKAISKEDEFLEISIRLPLSHEPAAKFAGLKA